MAWNFHSRSFYLKKEGCSHSQISFFNFFLILFNATRAYKSSLRNIPVLIWKIGEWKKTCLKVDACAKTSLYIPFSQSRQTGILLGKVPLGNIIAEGFEMILHTTLILLIPNLTEHSHSQLRLYKMRSYTHHTCVSLQCIMALPRNNDMYDVI